MPYVTMTVPTSCYELEISDEMKELIIKLQSSGLNERLIRRMVNSDELVARVVEQVQGVFVSPNQNRAKEIMGWNFFGVQRGCRIFWCHTFPRGHGNFVGSSFFRGDIGGEERVSYSSGMPSFFPSGYGGEDRVPGPPS